MSNSTTTVRKSPPLRLAFIDGDDATPTERTVSDVYAAVALHLEGRGMCQTRHGGTIVAWEMIAQALRNILKDDPDSKILSHSRGESPFEYFPACIRRVIAGDEWIAEVARADRDGAPRPPTSTQRLAQAGMASYKIEGYKAFRGKRHVSLWSNEFLRSLRANLDRPEFAGIRHLTEYLSMAPLVDAGIGATARFWLEGAYLRSAIARNQSARRAMHLRRYEAESPSNLAFLGELFYLSQVELNKVPSMPDESFEEKAWRLRFRSPTFNFRAMDETRRLAFKWARDRGYVAERRSRHEKEPDRIRIPLRRLFQIAPGKDVKELLAQAQRDRRLSKGAFRVC